jgi:hypothetical protein
MPIRGDISQRILRSTCSRHWSRTPVTARTVRQPFAGSRLKNWPFMQAVPNPKLMSELAGAIHDFLGDRARRNDSPHTLRNYGADLQEFLEYFSPPGTKPPALAGIDLLSLREWLAHLYDRDQKPATIRRKLASLRSLFRFLSR